MVGHPADMRRRLTWVALLVAVLVCVPSLVRATQSFNRDSGAIRLNRGFDAPESKCRIAPPTAALSTAVLVVLVAPRVVSTRPPVAFDAPLPSSLFEVSPPVLRGPPPLKRV